MWSQLNSGFGYWNVLVWIIFFAGISSFVLWIRLLGRMDYKRNTDQDEIYWEGNEVPDDGSAISVPASSSYWGFRVAMEPLYKLLDKFHSGSGSDYAGYFVVTVALVGLLVLIGGK
ncbi:hypothetical protein FACS1894204_03620 [Synergistales bacterium]|nr:hypothetical protein FACS1894204_03620 [Synergistales bacterium]